MSVTAEFIRVAPAGRAGDTRCAWCGKRLEESDKQPTVQGPVLLPLSIDPWLKKVEGHGLEILLSNDNKILKGIVMVEDSAAKKNGEDIIFLTCSRNCCDKVNSALERANVDWNEVKPLIEAYHSRKGFVRTENRAWP